jgi:hypothetical protein
MFAASQVGIGPFLGFSVDGQRRFFISTNTIRVELPLSFNNVTNAAVTRTNLGLGATWLTNTNASEFRTAIGLIDTNGVSVFSALFLWDETNDEAALRVDEGEIITSEALIKTNGPTDTTNAARWIKVQGGTNNYFIPLFQ